MRFRSAVLFAFIMNGTNFDEHSCRSILAVLSFFFQPIHQPVRAAENLEARPSLARKMFLPPIDFTVRKRALCRKRADA